MKIYTRRGDQGETGLLGGGRVRKDDPRVSAYGEVDELNAALGFARSQGLSGSLDALAERVQRELFSLGSQLAARGRKASGKVPRVEAAWILALERDIDRMEAELPPLSRFILPGGHPAAAALHLARTICRRAERRTVSLTKRTRALGPAVAYLNRLSDCLFVMARLENHRRRVTDVPWEARNRGQGSGVRGQYSGS